MDRTLAAIHVLKSRLRLTDEDYRALLRGLTGLGSSKDMTPAQRQQVRQHMQRLADRMLPPRSPASPGALPPEGAAPALGSRLRGNDRPGGGRMDLAQPRKSVADFEAMRLAASPRERKVWALWHQLRRDGVIRNGGAPALRAWVKRTAGVDAPRFCNGAQLDMLIEALKAWQQRATLNAKRSTSK